MSGAAGTGLRRDIGGLGARLLVLNGLIGAGIFALPGQVALNAGLLSPWLFLVVGLLFLAVVLSFAELASYYDASGGPVLYARDAFGPLVGFSTGWVLFISRVTSFAANATVMALYLGALVPSLDGPLGRAAVITVFVTVLTWINVLGVREGVRTMLVLSLLKLTPLLVMVLLGLGEVTGTTLLPGLSAPVESLGGTALMLIYAYVGFETIGITAGETRNPRSALPRALFRTVLLIGVLYFLVVLVFVAVIPAEDYGAATLIDVGRALAGPAGAVAITVAAVFSIGGNLSQSMIGAPRLLFAIAEQRMLPSRFARIHPRYHTPHVAIITMGGLGLLLALSGTFVELAVASSLARLLAYVACICALPAVRRQASERIRAEAFRLPGGFVLPVVALLICLWLILQTTRENWVAISGLLLAGLLLYLLENRAQRRGEPVSTEEAQP